MLPMELPSWNRREQAPKTPAALREIDIHASLNQLLIEFSQGGSAGGYLFRNRKGGPLWSASLAAHLKEMGVQGFHAARRFRITHLREFRCPEDILRFWAGHSSNGITDKYSKLSENADLRKQWSEKLGLGFDIPELCAVAPAPSPFKASKSAAAAKALTIVEAVPEVVPFQASDEDLPVELFQKPTELLMEVK